MVYIYILFYLLQEAACGPDTIQDTLWIVAKEKHTPRGMLEIFITLDQQIKVCTLWPKTNLSITPSNLAEGKVTNTRTHLR